MRKNAEVREIFRRKGRFEFLPFIVPLRLKW
jgi:hypothetical protein